MSSQPPVAFDNILKRAVSNVENQMDSIPGGAIAGEEEFEGWGKAFVKALVRFISFFACSFIC